MIIEQDGKALELRDIPFRLYASTVEFDNLAKQVAAVSRKVEIGWGEVNPSDENHDARITPQNPEIKQWNGDDNAR